MGACSRKDDDPGSTALGEAAHMHGLTALAAWWKHQAEPFAA